MINPIAFLILAGVAVAAALGMLLSRNAVHSALYLVLNFITVAVFYLVLNAPFIAMVQMIVYAGAIVVLFLFVIMLLGVDTSEDLSVEPISIQRPLAVIVGGGLVGTLVTAIVHARGSIRSSTGTGIAIPTQTGDGDANIRQVAIDLFSDHVFALELLSVLLIVAVVGTVVLSRKPPKKGAS